MKKIIIQMNEFNAEQRPTTQEDNYGQITDRWDLYHIYHFENNGNQTETKVGHLVKYFNGDYAVFRRRK